MNIKLITTAFFLLINISAHAKTSMTETHINMMKADGEFKRLSQCSGVSASILENGMRGAFNVCFKTASIQDDTTGNCTQKELINRTGITIAQLEACKPPEERINQSLDKIQERLSLLEDTQYELQQIAITDEQILELQTIEEKIESLYDEQAQLYSERDQLNPVESVDQRNKYTNKKMADILINAAKASQNSLKQITLPIYNNSNVIMHIPKTGSLKWGDLNIKTLPAATFSSQDDLDSIVEFYRRELPNYKLLKIDNTEYIFMQSMPDNFNILRHKKEYASTPHVNIKLTKNELGIMPEGTRAIIEVAYDL